MSSYNVFKKVCGGELTCGVSDHSGDYVLGLDEDQAAKVETMLRRAYGRGMSDKAQEIREVLQIKN